MSSIKKEQRNALAPQKRPQTMYAPERMHAQTKPKQTHTHLYRPLQSLKLPEHNQIQTLTKDAHLFQHMQTHAEPLTNKTTEKTEMHAAAAAVLYCHCHPRELRFLQHLSFGGTFMTLPLHSLPLAPYFALFMELGVLPW